MNWFRFRLGGTSVIPEKMAGVEIFNCNDDFISVNSIRLCGEKLNDASRIDDLTLNAPITDLANGPIVLPVRTNGAIVGRGFRVNYKLNPCQPTMMPPSEATEEIITEELPVQRTRIRIRKKYQWRIRIIYLLSLDSLVNIRRIVMTIFGAIGSEDWFHGNRQRFLLFEASYCSVEMDKPTSIAWHQTEARAGFHWFRINQCRHVPDSQPLIYSIQFLWR